MHRTMTSYLPDAYLKMDAPFLHDRIEEKRKAYGQDLIILGHYYQRYDVIRHSDFQGDSLDLSAKAAASRAKHIIF